MKIVAIADGIDLIRWEDGALLVLPLSKHEVVERVLSKPVEAWQSVDRLVDGVPTAIEERVVHIPPGTPEHAARALLQLQGAFLIEGDDAIPTDDSGVT